MEMYLFKLTIADGDMICHRDLIDGTDPDRVTSVGLAEQLTLRLKEDGAWPSVNARLVNIEWLGAAERVGADEAHQRRANRRIRHHLTCGRDVGFPTGWLGLQMVG